MAQLNQLRSALLRLDRKGYKAYREIQGEYQDNELSIAVDHVQSDPFAPPSRMRVIFDRSSLRLPEIRCDLERVALEDFVARRFRDEVSARRNKGSGTGKSSTIQIDAGHQEVIERTACRISDDSLELRVVVGLPAQGRSILGRAAADLLTDRLPELARTACVLDDAARRQAREFSNTICDAEALRRQLDEHGLVAFVADGAVLPRHSGVNNRPMTGKVIPFAAPESMRIELDCPNAGSVSGMGIPEGVTLIVGGGFHGKSTLLEAISRGVYTHIPGDGREFVVTRHDAVKVRAEDGRSVVGNDLNPFISNLPLGGDTRDFSSENASGSTSQAANILEALESGSRLLLMDEDTCATNFMIRDSVMKQLVPDESEPITPFVDRVRHLYESHGVSTVLVMGGAGDYFGVADNVIWMNEYRPYDVSERALSLVDRRRSDGNRVFPELRRVPDPSSIDPTRGNRTKTRARGTEELVFGRESIDLRQIEQIVDPSQTRGIAEILVHARSSGVIDGKRSIAEILDAIEQLQREQPFDTFSNFRGHPGDYAMPRRFEVAAALNRLRTLRVKQSRDF